MTSNTSAKPTCTPANQKPYSLPYSSSPQPSHLHPIMPPPFNQPSSNLPQNRNSHQRRHHLRIQVDTPRACNKRKTKNHLTNNSHQPTLVPAGHQIQTSSQPRREPKPLELPRKQKPKPHSTEHLKLAPSTYCFISPEITCTKRTTKISRLPPTSSNYLTWSHCRATSSATINCG